VIKDTGGVHAAAHEAAKGETAADATDAFVADVAAGTAAAPAAKERKPIKVSGTRTPRSRAGQ